MTGQDAVRQRFTGYQRDLETGLDFAEARYYNNSHGRFTAVDPLLASGKSANHQTFNRYAYTMNRPSILNDATGLQAGKPSPPEQKKQTPPKEDEVNVTNAPVKDGYQLRITGYTPIAINNGVVTDEAGNVVKDPPITVTNKTDGFGIIVRYELSTGTTFPAPDEGTTTTIEEKITNSTSDGKPGPQGDVATKPIPGVNVEGKIAFSDWVGTRNNSGPPKQVVENDQAITINATVGGNRESWVIRTNHIVTDPNGQTTVKIEETTPKHDEEPLE